MVRPQPRADFVEGTSRFYDVLRHLARERGRRFTTSWLELIVASGYDELDQVRTSVERYASTLTEIGLVRVGPVWVGRAWGLQVEVFDPRSLPSAAARPCSSTGRAADS